MSKNSACLPRFQQSMQNSRNWSRWFSVALQAIHHGRWREILLILSCHPPYFYPPTKLTISSPLQSCRASASPCASLSNKDAQDSTLLTHVCSLGLRLHVVAGWGFFVCFLLLPFLVLYFCCCFDLVSFWFCFFVLFWGVLCFFLFVRVFVCFFFFCEWVILVRSIWDVLCWACRINCTCIVIIKYIRNASLCLFTKANKVSWILGVIFIIWRGGGRLCEYKSVFLCWSPRFYTLKFFIQRAR